MTVFSVFKSDLSRFFSLGFRDFPSFEAVRTTAVRTGDMTVAGCTCTAGKSLLHR
jgi:hypothetical protein